MTDRPAGIDLARHRDVAGRGGEPWFRRGFLAVLCVVVAAALANVFGQRPQASVARTNAATLTLDGATRIRGGLLGQATIRVAAARAIEHPGLVLERGWLDSITINTITPDPAEQKDVHGSVRLAYDRLPAGGDLTIRIEYQVNPTALGKKPAGVALVDGDTSIAAVHRSLTVLP
jgi:hypothetical protein